MKLLFFARHWSYLRNFEAAIEDLARRGHRVHMAADVEESMGGRQMIERLVARYPEQLSMGESPARHVGPWFDLTRRIRHGLDYLRYLEPLYATTPHLLARARQRTPRVVLALLTLSFFGSDRGRQRLARLLRALERALPRMKATEEFIAAHQPDAVLVTPLVDLGSPQIDHVRAAKVLGTRTVLPVCSWDHLSTKSLLRFVPDAVIVWNNVQRTEAIEMHGVPAEKIIVTGAQCYDQWWGRRPSRSREVFCERVGLPSDRPFVLYVCSALFHNTADEPSFVLDWIETLRSSDDPRLKDIGILVRPHPARLKEWQGVDLTGYRNVAFWGAHPVDAEAKDDYFDSIYYSAAVVGLNTSAFLEAAVIGRPAHTVLVPEISTRNQEGTLHFRYLLAGLLRAARSLDEHARLLAASLRGEGEIDSQSRDFAVMFVRPLGAEVAATPQFVDALERVVAAPAPAPERLGWREFLLRVPLYPAVALVALRTPAQLWWKHLRSRIRKDYRVWKRRVLGDLKRFAIRQLGSKRPGVVAPSPPSALTPKPGRHRDPAKRSWVWDVPEALETRELVTLLGRSDKPILVGPWLSETGFELLYWIPFLAWAKTYGNFDPERLVVISRGGAAPWYSHLTANYEDILSYYTPEQFRRRNEERIAEQSGRMKHLDVSSFDREIIARVTAARGLRGAEILHPSTMYRLFEQFWFQRAPVTIVETFTSFSPLPPMEPFALRGQLPARYVAAKFYGNVALPPTAANRAFAARFLADLAQHIDVVLLNTADRYDDHDDFPSDLRGRIHTIDHLMRPIDNLAVQTQVIRHAQAFVGTYGGFCYLAPLAGTGTIAFYSHASGFRFDHLEVAKRVFSGLRCGAFVELDIRAVDVVRLGFGIASPVLEGVRT
ncbi:MAG: hypothetical protein HYY76_11930 [Acidobacteria bacterium]|nr:hypothetical protein [Acidobacteriota bacterium]